MDPNDFVTTLHQTTYTTNSGFGISVGEFFSSDDNFKWLNEGLVTKKIVDNGKTDNFIKSILTEFKESCKITSNDDLISSMVKNEKLALLKEVEKRLIGG